MARIQGVELPDNKKVKISLTYIYGIGQHIAKEILEMANIDGDKRTHELTSEEIQRIGKVIDENYPVEGELKQKIQRNIKRLKEIRCYRGVRHKLGLPVRGQRTRTNAVTRKGKNIAVGGLNKTIEKK